MQAASAQQIYKSVDKNGKVTYSSEPVKNAVAVKTVAHPAPLNPREVEHAQKRLQEFEAREAEREKEQRDQEREALRQRQIQADLELKREIANQKPANVILVNQYPFVRSSRYRPMGNLRNTPMPHTPAPQPMPQPTTEPKELRHSADSSFYRR
ncbi:MAG: DUF4124 domain-containing protein [Methylococcales bacterium]